jgi:hypothetical protein
MIGESMVDCGISWVSIEPGPTEKSMKPSLVLALAALGLSPVLQAAEPAALVRLHEEEILAHDLYVALSKVHSDLMPLRNIPSSEARHRDAMAAILAKEKIPAAEVPAGRRFSSPGLDRLFKAWFEEGKKSPADACRVGVRLEEHDIADLRKAQVDFPAHKEVFAALEAASNNHLRAFHRNLTRHGGIYQPEVLTAAELKAILDGTQRACGCEGACGADCAKPGAKGQGGPGRGRGPGGPNGRGKGAKTE